MEESKVESIKRDKTATETLLQETIERHQSELSLQKDFYTNALAAAKEAEALAEARINNEARTELETRLREAEERESMLVQTLEELRQTLSRKEQQVWVELVLISATVHKLAEIQYITHFHCYLCRLFLEKTHFLGTSKIFRGVTKCVKLF